MDNFPHCFLSLPSASGSAAGIVGPGTGNIVCSRSALAAVQLQLATRRALAGFPAEAKR